MNTKKIHNTLGLILLLPLLGWIVTGVIFLIKPGYAGAYDQISPKLYAMQEENNITPQKSWMEVRLLKTILGQHLLVKIDGEWQHLDPMSYAPQAKPSEEQEILLLSDAISHNYDRYGDIKSNEGDFYLTSSGVELSLDWNTLKISQKGSDTKLISTLYKIHYLQWLGNKQANKVFGVLGLLALTLLVFYGVVSYVKRLRDLS